MRGASGRQAGICLMCWLPAWRHHGLPPFAAARDMHQGSNPMLCIREDDMPPTTFPSAPPPSGLGVGPGGPRRPALRLPGRAGQPARPRRHHAPARPRRAAPEEPLLRGRCALCTLRFLRRLHAWLGLVQRRHGACCTFWLLPDACGMVWQPPLGAGGPGNPAWPGLSGVCGKGAPADVPYRMSVLRSLIHIWPPPPQASG